MALTRAAKERGENENGKEDFVGPVPRTKAARVEDGPGTSSKARAVPSDRDGGAMAPANRPKIIHTEQGSAAPDQIKTLERAILEEVRKLQATASRMMEEVGRLSSDIIGAHIWVLEKENERLFDRTTQTAKVAAFKARLKDFIQAVHTNKERLAKLGPKTTALERMTTSEETTRSALRASRACNTAYTEAHAVWYDATKAVIEAVRCWKGFHLSKNAATEKQDNREAERQWTWLMRSLDTTVAPVPPNDRN